MELKGLEDGAFVAAVAAALVRRGLRGLALGVLALLELGTFSKCG